MSHMIEMESRFDMTKWVLFNDELSDLLEAGRTPKLREQAAKLASFLEMEECYRMYILLGAPTVSNYELFEALLTRLMSSLTFYKLEWDVHPLWTTVIGVLGYYDHYRERVAAIVAASGMPPPPPPLLDDDVLRELSEFLFADE